MMVTQHSDKELLELLDSIESDRVERKESFAKDAPNKVCQAVCAFTNDLPNYNLPGVIFIGAKDNGEPSQINITDQLLCSLADIRADGNILPLPVLTVEKRVMKGSEMAVVTVMPSDMPPVKFKGRIWIRTGPRRGIANEQEERVLVEKRRFKNLPFDLHPVASAKLSDLSKLHFQNEYLPSAFAADVLEENNRSYEERLASCRMIVSPRDTTPTVSGLIALAKNPQDFLSGAYIQFLRIDGTELADMVIDEENIGGAIFDMLRGIEEKLNAHNRLKVDVGSNAVHIKEQLYPMPAMRQLVYNAVLHRSYERTNAPIRIYWFNDRIEITSPGGPFGNVTAENFGEPGITDYRNPNIADILRTFGYVQAFGRGIAIARRELQNNGNPELEFIVNQSTVQATIRRNP